MSMPALENVHLKKMFRKDINILRAIAVLAVIFFHFGFGFARGGYIGVDIFFVISGYLMTSIILSRSENGRFSFPGFYISRFLRIVPALAIVCLAFLVIGWLFLFPYDFAYLSRNINHSLAFKSNICFAKGSGYFDIGNDIKWLLHTWSLSVEMQFYALYPIVLIVFYKLLGMKSLRWILVAASLASFAAYVWTTFYADPNHAFYLLPYRVWELLAGALVVVFPIYTQSSQNSQAKTLQILRLLGGILIALSIGFANGHGDFAAAWALIATFGTTLILATYSTAKIRDIPILKQFGNFIYYSGLISYSLYLWHWPIRSLQQYFGYEESLPVTLAAMGVTYICGALSYHFIEKKAHVRIEFGKIFTRRTGLILLVSLIAPVLAYSASKIIREEQGFVQRLKFLPYDNIPTYLFENPELYLLEGIANKCRNDGTGCQLAKGQKIPLSQNWVPDIILAGDSHAVSISQALSETPFGDRSLNVLLSSSSACIYMNDFEFARIGDRKFNRCKRAYLNFLALLEKTPANIPLLLVNHYAAYLNAKRWKEIWYEAGNYGTSSPVPLTTAWLDLVCKISKERKVYIMRTVPIMPVSATKKILQNALQGTTASLRQKSFSLSTVKHNQNTENEKNLLDKAEKQCGVELIDPQESFCENGLCYSVSPDLRPFYRDTSHLSLYGSRKLIPLFSKTFDK